MEKDRAQVKSPKRGGRMGGGMMAVEKPKNFKKSLIKLVRALKPHRLAILVAIIFAIASTVFSIISPKILGNMTNQIVDDFVATRAYSAIVENLPEGIEIPKGTTVEDLPRLLQGAAMSGQLTPEQIAQMQEMSEGMNSEEMLESVPAAQLEQIKQLDLSEKPKFHYEVLARIAAFLIGIYLVSALCGYGSGWLLTGMTQKFVLKMRRDISEKVNRLPISYFDKHQFGDTLSRVTNDVDTVAQSLNQSLNQLISSVVMLVGILVMMLTISWQMTLIALAVLPVSTGFIGFITKYSQKYFKSQQDELGELNGHVEEIYAGQTIVKAFSGEKRAIDKFEGTNEKLYRSGWKSQFLSGLMFPIMNLISNLGYVASAVMGGWLAIQGRISIGDIQAFIQYVSQFNQPITQVAQIMNVLQSAVAASERVFEFLEEPEEVADSNKAITMKRVKGEIEFDDVKFGYEEGQEVIKGFSARIPAGSKVAIVGPTGAGKTTIVNLLMRFYDPWEGKITIDGVNTREMKRAEVRKQFGMVLQDTWLFNGTIEENLKYGDLKADERQLLAAAKAAHVDHFVSSLPDGYKTKLDDDAESVSAGEKQLLTIARAMLADAPMMILDEATSSVDTRTEVLIQSAMEKLTHGRTSFIIAHRLSTIRDADMILVMKEGNIVEQGNHKELMKQGGFYAELYNSQFVED